MSRILQPYEREQHIKNHSWPTITPEGAELLGDLATVNGNRRHNPETGFLDFFPDTPEWVREIAYRREWASRPKRGGEIE